MMKISSDELQASYAFCRRLSRRSGSNFYLGFLLLPREKRSAMHALYAFMRHTDDLVDAAPVSLGNDLYLCESVDQRRENLSRWRDLLENSLAGKASFSNLSHTSMEPATDAESTGKFVLPALVDTVQKYRIPAECLYSVLDGVEMDLDPGRYETFEKLQLYCRRVASAVGLACIYIWGFSGQETPEGDCAVELARQAGIALQLTNILRDLKADAALDRVYLPLEDLRNCGYSVEELKKGVVNEAFYRVMEMEINRARQLYQQGWKLFDFLDRDGRRIFGLMMSVYRSLLEKITRRPGQVFSRPVRLGKLEQIIHFISWTLIPSIMADKCSRSDKR